MNKFTTGLAALDYLTCQGGIKRGELCLVLGAAGSGKTAFCRNMILANNMQGSLGIHGKELGSHDLLIMGSKAEFFANYLPELQRSYEYTAILKKMAQDKNVAIVWTIPTMIPTMNRMKADPLPEDYNPMSSADQVIHLHENTLRLMKNRNGMNGLSKVQFENYHNIFSIMKDA